MEKPKDLIELLDSFEAGLSSDERRMAKVTAIEVSRGVYDQLLNSAISTTAQLHLIGTGVELQASRYLSDKLAILVARDYFGVLRLDNGHITWIDNPKPNFTFAKWGESINA